MYTMRDIQAASKKYRLEARKWLTPRGVRKALKLKER